MEAQLKQNLLQVLQSCWKALNEIKNTKLNSTEVKTSYDLAWEVDKAIHKLKGEQPTDIKIVIEIGGGVMQRVVANFPINYVIVDWDNIRDGDTALDRFEAHVGKPDEHLDKSKAQDRQIIKELKRLQFLT